MVYLGSDPNEQDIGRINKECMLIMWQLGPSSCGDLSEGHIEYISELAYGGAVASIHQFQFLTDYE